MSRHKLRLANIFQIVVAGIMTVQLIFIIIIGFNFIFIPIYTPFILLMLLPVIIRNVLQKSKILEIVVYIFKCIAICGASFFILIVVVFGFHDGNLPSSIVVFLTAIIPLLCILLLINEVIIALLDKKSREKLDSSYENN